MNKLKLSDEVGLFEELFGCALSDWLSKYQQTSPSSLADLKGSETNYSYKSMEECIARSILSRMASVSRYKHRLSQNLDISATTQLLTRGFYVINNVLSTESLNILRQKILTKLDKSTVDNCSWHNSLSMPNVGSCFIPTSINEAALVASVARQALSQVTTESTGYNLVLHRHFKGDRDAMFHVDHMGTATYKWFYFPFGTMNGDDGFRFIDGSHRLYRSKAKYLCDLVKDYHAKKSIDQKRYHSLPSFLKTGEMLSFSNANTMVIADTSGFHARAVARVSGIERITIQGGIANKKTFQNY